MLSLKVTLAAVRGESSPMDLTPLGPGDTGSYK